MSALDVALALTICGAPDGVEHTRVKTHFSRLTAIMEGNADKLKKLDKLPKMEGEWVEVCFASEYTEPEKLALEKVGKALESAGAGVMRVTEGDWKDEVDRKTMVYSVGGIEGVFEKARPAVVVGVAEEGR